MFSILGRLNGENVAMWGCRVGILSERMWETETDRGGVWEMET